MTIDKLPTPSRRAARAPVVALGLGLALVASPAHASPPDSWPAADNGSTLWNLLLFIGVPVLVALLLALLVYLPAMMRGRSSEEAFQEHAEWFGGPRQGTDAAATGGLTRTPRATRSRVVPVASGDGFAPGQRASIDRAIRDAETISRYEFSVFVGAVEGEPRAFAERLHEALVAPSISVLVMVDPVGRHIQVVTGEEARRELDDHEVALAIVEMQSHFALGDLTGGIVRGLTMLASYARKPPLLHEPPLPHQ